MDNDTAGAGVGAGAGAFAGADTVAGERNVGRMTRREIKALWKSAVTVGDWERLAHRLALSASAARVCGGTHESQRLERLASAARNLSAIVEARVHDEAVAIRAALRVRLDGITAAHVACVEPVLSSVRETMARVEGCDAGLQDTMDLIVRIEGEVAELQRRLSDARVRLASWDAERDDLLARLSSLCEEHDTFEQRAMELGRRRRRWRRRKSWRWCCAQLMSLAGFARSIGTRHGLASVMRWWICRVVRMGGLRTAVGRRRRRDVCGRPAGVVFPGRVALFERGVAGPPRGRHAWACRVDGDRMG